MHAKNKNCNRQEGKNAFGQDLHTANIKVLLILYCMHMIQ